MSYLKTGNSFITVNGNRIAYRELSKGKSKIPLVMLVHLAANMDNWDPKLIDILAEKQHVILVDLPGIGDSQGKVAASIPGMAEQGIFIIKEFGYSKINLLGLSMGGMTAQEIVKLDNQLVNKLILVGTGPRGGKGIKNIIGITFKYIFKAVLEKTDPKRFIFYNHDKEGKMEAEKVLRRLAERNGKYLDKATTIPSFLRQLRAIRKWGKEKADNLSFINQPTLIINGDNDLMVATENSYDMHDRIANNKLVIYPNSSHGSLFQFPEKFSDEVQNFLK
jgi:alpha/beta hydrolase, putative